MSTVNTNSAESASMALTPETAPCLCARQLIIERIAELVRHEAGTRSGEDIEALHDMRVASRRLREALEIFQFCFPPKTYDRLYERVRRVTRALGQARNADVAVAYFTELLSHSEELVEQVALQDILRRLVKRQARARAEMQKELDKVQPDKFPGRFEKTFAKLAQNPPARRRGPRTALQLARRLLAQRLREFFLRRRLITGEEDVEGLHNLRIAVKKLRYALETLDFAAGENLKENLRFFKKLQTALGDLHDRDVFAEIVQKRMNKLQKQSFATHLLNGYQTSITKIGEQRHELYLDYVKQFGKAKVREWRQRVVPPPPPKASELAPLVESIELKKIEVSEISP
jgi:CHAD domain-containing protein